MSSNLLAGYSQPASLPCDDILFPVASVSGALSFERYPSFEQWGVIIRGSSSKTLRLQPGAFVQLGIQDTSWHLRPQIHSDLLNVSRSVGMVLIKWEQCTVWAHLVECSTGENILGVGDTANIKINKLTMYLLAISNMLKHPNSCCYGMSYTYQWQLPLMWRMLSECWMFCGHQFGSRQALCGQRRQKVLEYFLFSSPHFYEVWGILVSPRCSEHFFQWI